MDTDDMFFPSIVNYVKNEIKTNKDSRGVFLNLSFKFKQIFELKHKMMLKLLLKDELLPYEFKEIKCEKERHYNQTYMKVIINCY